MTVLQEFQAAVSAIEKCSKPVIAAAHGLCMGLAIDILSAADIRFAVSQVAIYSVPRVLLVAGCIVKIHHQGSLCYA
jgi:delta(3,5)-delta(2,4)-dienoyl-CoA isomerase